MGLMTAVRRYAALYGSPNQRLNVYYSTLHIHRNKSLTRDESVDWILDEWRVAQMVSVPVTVPAKGGGVLSDGGTWPKWQA